MIEIPIWAFVLLIIMAAPVAVVIILFVLCVLFVLGLALFAAIVPDPKGGGSNG